MRSKFFQESRAINCQDIEELRRFCCEETDTARQLRTDELSTQHERNPTTVSQLLTQNSGFAEQREFPGRCKRILRSRDSEQLWIIPRSRQPLNFPSPIGKLSRDSGLPLDTRSTMGASGNVFASLPAREGPSSALFENSRNLASSSCGFWTR